MRLFDTCMWVCFDPIIKFKYFLTGVRNIEAGTFKCTQNRISKYDDEKKTHTE